jgi:hypothetical protein
VEFDQLHVDETVAKERKRLERPFDPVSGAVEDQDGAWAAGRVCLEK